MKIQYLCFLSVFLPVIFTGCSELAWQAAQLPGLRQLNDEMNEQAFIDWMKSDPRQEVEARAKKGSYSFMGLTIQSEGDYWIPGVTQHIRNYPHHDVTWFPMGSRRDLIPLAERYMTVFNQLILEARKGVKLDVHGDRISRSISPALTVA